MTAASPCAVDSCLKSRAPACPKAMYDQFFLEGKETDFRTKRSIRALGGALKIANATNHSVMIHLMLSVIRNKAFSLLDKILLMKGQIKYVAH